MRVFLSLLVLSFLVSLSLSLETVITPFGIRPKQCHLEVPHGARVSEENGRLKVELATLDEFGKPLTKYFDSDPICGEDIDAIRESYRRKSRFRARSPAIDINGWLDYGGWYPPSGESNLFSFNATYVVPGNPSDTTSDQVLFYFIGMQDNDDAAVNIIQPVLTWGNGISDEWYVKSWACCPSNITTSSPPVTGLKTGDTMQGIIVRESDSTWKIDSVFNGQHTTLNAQVGDYNYNWADVTLEVYNVESCDEFATGKLTFSNIEIQDAQGANINPTWQFTGATACGGSITQGSGGDVSIQHTG